MLAFVAREHAQLPATSCGELPNSIYSSVRQLLTAAATAATAAETNYKDFFEDNKGMRCVSSHWTRSSSVQGQGQGEIGRVIINGIIDA